MNVLQARVATHKAPGGGGSRFRFYAIGDLHIDKKQFDRDRAKRYIDHIAADPCAYWVLVGDIIDGTTPDHRFFDPASTRRDALEAMDRYYLTMLEQAVELLGPLKGTAGLVIEGNHDIRGAGRWVGFAAHLARELGVEYGGGEALVRLHAQTPDPTRGDYVWVIHAQHGAGGGMYPGGRINRFQNTATLTADADIYVRGHVHDSHCRVVPRYTVTRKGAPALKERPIAYLTAPALMRGRVEGVVDYPGRKGLPANDEGVIYLEVANPDNNAHRSETGRHSARIRRIEADI